DQDEVYESGTSGTERERAATEAEALADKRARVGDRLFRSGGGHDEQVDGVGRDPGVLDRVRARVDGHRRGRVGRGRDVTLADAGPLDDPRVGRVDTPFEIGVREELFRDGRAPA